MQPKTKPDFSKLPVYAGTIQYVREHPRVHTADAAKATDVKLPTTRKRLTRLQAEAFLTADHYSKALLFYVSKGSACR